jgi:filamentous hemagglutinin family protein
MGEQAGPNLFHSFEKLSLRHDTPAGPESAHFEGGAGVENSLARVTGGDASNIDDKPGADANLYLMNPSGIVFGPNATLDVDGSFHATTASSIRLGESGRFEASPGAQGLLPVAPSSGFGFLSASPGTISATGAGLQDKPGSGLLLVGGTVDLDGASIQASGGMIHLAALANPSDVALGAPPSQPATRRGGGAVVLSTSTVDAGDPHEGAGGRLDRRKLCAARSRDGAHGQPRHDARARGLTQCKRQN